jgi:galactose mutarotase-like enzyme
MVVYGAIPLTLRCYRRLVVGKSTSNVRATYTQPGLPFYAGNLLDNRLAAKTGQIDCHRGFYQETQHFPDSPYQPDFPSVVLDPESQYEHTTVYKFTAG